ncbi:MAG: hypothetical protein KIS84_08180 [Dokdonella sp.]|nr:hypothetical protein [Dokdonella sp.]
MKDPAEKLLDVSKALTRARQCDSLLDVLRTELNGIDIEVREAELIALAHDLASDLYLSFWGDSQIGAFPGGIEASSLVGKLQAATRAMVDTVDMVSREPDENQRRGHSTNVGWLQYIASDILEELVPLLERAASSATGPQFEPPVGLAA